MGDRNWNSYKSKEVQTQLISKSVFVTNFPDHICARDLWKICNDYGSVVDAFIPFKRSKVGTLNNDKEKETQPALVLDDSCFIDRQSSISLMRKVKEFISLSNLKVVLANEGFDDINIKYIGGFWVMIEFQSKKSKENFLSRVGVGSWFSNLQEVSESFYVDERVAWVDIEGVPLKAWTTNTFSKIISKWGELIYKDDKEESCFHRKRVCIKTKMMGNIFKSFKIIAKGKIFWILAKEVIGWNPDFMEEEDLQSDSDNATLHSESDINEIPETVFENDKEDFNEANSHNKGVNESPFEDPFHIYDSLDKKQKNNTRGDQQQTDETLKYPPGFTPKDTLEVNLKFSQSVQAGDKEGVQEDFVSQQASEKSKEEGEISACSGHF
ncbi:nucleotide-binding alpha-beta plait domain-containing protein [Tanacetum coccineum]